MTITQEEFELELENRGLDPQGKPIENQGDEFTTFVSQLPPDEREAIVNKMQGYLNQAENYKNSIVAASAGAQLSQMTGADIDEFVKDFGHRPSAGKIAEMSVANRRRLGLPID